MANQGIRIYVNSCGKKSDQDFRWKLIINDEQQPLETPEIIEKEIIDTTTNKKALPVKQLIVKPESHSLVIARDHQQLLLLVTGLEAPERTKEYGRRVRNSVAWVFNESQENEKKLRKLAVHVLEYFLNLETTSNLGEEIDKAVEFCDNNYGFKVLFQRIEQLIPPTDTSESNSAEAQSPIAITDNWDNGIKELVKDLQQYRLPKRDGVLVVVTGLQTEETLKNTGVWKGIAKKLVKEKNLPISNSQVLTPSPQNLSPIIKFFSALFVSFLVLFLLLEQFLPQVQQWMMKNRIADSTSNPAEEENLEPIPVSLALCSNNTPNPSTPQDTKKKIPHRLYLKLAFALKSS